MKTTYFVIFCLGLGIAKMFGHEQIVHQVITINAAEAALDNSHRYAGFLKTVSSDLPSSGLVSATNYLVIGSFDEDFGIHEDPIGGYRSYNHFYDPLTGSGLSETPLGEALSPIGNDIFTWASTSNCPGVDFDGILGFIGRNVGTYNTWSWQNARGYEWVGLTAANQMDRRTALSEMFRSVGQVMHLLQDASQPQHVRNEQHLDSFWQGGPNTPWRSPIEDYGRDHVSTLNYQHGMLDWRSDGFTKLEDFWNRHLYNGNGAALNEAETPGGTQLGLAEWCNGNFLGARHLFPEYFEPEDISYYPYPSRNTSTDYPQKVANLASGVQTRTYRNGHQGKTIYVNKTGDGVTYPDISCFTYFGARFPSFGMMTINDPNVLSNYHNVIIPKAVEYSAGLLDYFFRGTMAVGVTNLNDGTFGLLITNTSSQDFAGGAFHLFYDDANGNRAEMTSGFSTAYAGTLLSSNFIYAFFTPTNTATSYLLVYQGSIGTTDPVDAGIAVAVKKLPPPRTCPSLVDSHYLGGGPNWAIVYASGPKRIITTREAASGGEAIVIDPSNDSVTLVNLSEPMGFESLGYAPSANKLYSFVSYVEGIRVYDATTLAFEGNFFQNQMNWYDASDFIYDAVNDRLWFVAKTQLLSINPASDSIASDTDEGVSLWHLTYCDSNNCIYATTDSGVAVIDAASKVIIASIAVPDSNGGNILYVPENGKVYVTGYNDGTRQTTLSVINPADNSVETTIYTGIDDNFDASIVYHPPTKTIWVDAVSAYRTTDNSWMCSMNFPAAYAYYPFFYAFDPISGKIFFPEAGWGIDMSVLAAN